MKLLSGVLIFLLATVAGGHPITTTDVFVQSGEVSDSSIVIMVRCNTEMNSKVFIILEDETLDVGEVTMATDYTVSHKIDDLSSNTVYEYLVTCDAGSTNATSMIASFKTLPSPGEATDISFVWVADLAGQGWGRNPYLEVTHVDGHTMTGGYVVFETMKALNPDFALFQGDMIYADNAIPVTKEIPEDVGGGTWTNDPSLDYAAVSLEEFRNNWKYNHGDDKMQSFLAQTPIFVQWDDHEVTNNWWPGEVLEYTRGQYPNNTDVDEMFMNALQSFYEFNPILPDSLIYRSQKFGKHLEVFMPDYRSYRDPNPGNSNPEGIAMMGEAQLEWLKDALKSSTATWKIISSHDPFGIVTGGEGDRDAFGQLDPAILGRELEVKELFEFIKINKIENVVSLTSDVHFRAHLNIHPSRAEGGFTNFTPLDEFVIGPIHAGAFGPGRQDTSFGPEYVYVEAPGTLGLGGNQPPSKADLQSFGHASVTKAGKLTLSLTTIAGEVVYAKTLAPKSIAGELPITTSNVFVQSGEVSDSSIVIMARCNKEVDETVTLELGDSSIEMGRVSATTDYTISSKVEGLSSKTIYSYTVMCGADSSMPASFKTLPSSDEEAAVSFVWSADLAGQGWGRNPDFSVTHVDGHTISGGYVVFETMKALNPDFALFQGDMIYADGAIPATKDIPEAMGGGTWKNDPSKDFNAITLEEFRANWKYNHGDEKMQAFLAETPVFVQWDDHEVTNNWWPGEVLEYTRGQYPNNTDVDPMYLNSLQSFYEFNPILPDSLIYRSQKFGKHLEIFFPDFRSYRDANPGNSDPAGIAMMGEEQLEWLKEGLKSSTATWKIISAHDPFGIVTGGPGDRDSFGQEDPAILGRELEVKELLEFIHTNEIAGVVSLSSDVHFTAHVNMHPDRAEGGFTDFTPLDEFVIGPIHAGSFGPNFQDTSFGALYEYEMGPLTAGFERWANLPPSQSNLQSFGYAAVSESGELSISLTSITGDIMYSKTLSPKSVDGGDATSKCIRRKK